VGTVRKRDRFFTMLESLETGSRNEEQNRDMIGFEVNSAEYWDWRFEVDWAQEHGCERTRYFARVFLDSLPVWLEDEIRANGLSICDWGCAEGEAVDSFRAHFPQSRITGIDWSSKAIRKAQEKFGTEYFIGQDVLTNPLPVTFDILATSNVLQYFQAPWPVLRKLGAHAARHLLILVPFREGNRVREHLYSFDDATIGTHIDPDFILSSCKVIDCRQHSDGYWPGSQILLVYSRSRYFPHSGTTFEVSADETGPGISGIVERNEVLSRELGRATSLLEVREAELKKFAQREAAFRSDAQYWELKVGALGKQLEQQVRIEIDLRAEQQRLQQEVERLGMIEKSHTAESQILSSRANTSAYEAATLRRLVTELQTSLSWRITAPLRFLTRPLFRAAAKASPQNTQPESARTATLSKQEMAVDVSVPSPAPGNPIKNRIETLILPELRRAQPIAVVSCALPFSSTLNHRPISCARYFADHGYTVLFVEVWGTPEEARHQAGEEVYPGIFAISLDDFRDNLDLILPAAHAKRSYLCTIPHRGLVGLVRPLQAAGYHIHYDIMDDWEEFHRADEAEWYSLSVEREVVVLSDTLSAVSEKLVQKFEPLRSDVVVVQNGFQPSALACEQFIAANTPLDRPKVVGYFGHFSDGWFDWDTVFYAAQKRPDIEFELIGWGLSERARVRLKDFPNIRFEGLVPQNNLHRYARKWWAAMIPFRPSTLSAAVDPLKIYEYLYLGLSSVVTGISGIAGYPLVQYADDREGFVSALDKLPDRPDKQSLSAAAEFLKTCVWEARLAKLNSMISEPVELAHGQLYGQ
jgi:hypothetical protein